MAGTLRVGILGSGWAAGAHAAAYSRLPNVSIVGLWSRTRDHADALASKLGQPSVKVYDRWQDLLERGELDVVSIATSPQLRREPFEAALARRLHVLVEKPLARNVAEARAMVDLATRTGTVTALCLNWRYSPGCQTAWTAIEEGQTGKTLDLRIQMRRPQAILDPIRPWVYEPEIGGTLREGGYHHLDRLRFLGRGEFTRVLARLIPPDGIEAPPDHPEYIIDNSYSVLGQLATGAEAFTSFSPANGGEPERQFVILGENGTLRVVGDAVVYRQRAGDAEPVQLPVHAVDQPAIDAAFTELIQHTWDRLVAEFVTAVRENDVEHRSVPHLARLDDGVRIEQVIAAARRSQVEWRWIDLAEMS